MQKTSTSSLPSLSVCIDLDTGARIGPGKIKFLENIRACGAVVVADRRCGLAHTGAAMATSGGGMHVTKLATLAIKGMKRDCWKFAPVSATFKPYFAAVALTMLAKADAASLDRMRAQQVCTRMRVPDQRERPAFERLIFEKRESHRATADQ